MSNNKQQVLNEKQEILNNERQTYIIVGQGIAGTLLSYFLLKAGQNVIIIDNHHIGSSSKAAAGIINPITGRHYVKSWRIDELLPFAEQTYHELEKLLQISIYHSRNVIRTFANVKEEND
ncbi:MAG: FAD-dependent oxidoreductase [Saprospiraceae bacterium]